MADAVVYVSIWLGVGCFVAGEVGKRYVRLPQGWAWHAWIAGACLTALHMAAALGVVHEWSHETAVAATARQTASIYGLSWRGGIYVNYLFLGIWTLEIVWWRVDPISYFGRRLAFACLLRVFYFVMLVNAAVVFVTPSRRALGLVLLAVLLWAWRPQPQNAVLTSAASTRAS